MENKKKTFAHIERYAGGSVLLATEHRYGLGVMAAMVGENQLDYVESLATGGGCDPVTFGLGCAKTGLPVAFGRTLLEALDALDEKLSRPDCHDPSSAWYVLEDVNEAEACLLDNWPVHYAQVYARYTGGGAQ